MTHSDHVQIHILCRFSCCASTGFYCQDALTVCKTTVSSISVFSLVSVGYGFDLTKNGVVIEFLIGVCKECKEYFLGSFFSDLKNVAVASALDVDFDDQT